MTDLQTLAERIVRDFSRMAERDGGKLLLDSAEGSQITLCYQRGGDVDCAAGICVLESAELQQLIEETVARRAPGVKVVVRETA